MDDGCGPREPGTGSVDPGSFPELIVAAFLVGGGYLLGWMMMDRVNRERGL